MATTINKKINHIYYLLEKLAKGEELYPQNLRLQEELEVNERTLRRYLEDIFVLYPHIVLTQKVVKEFSDKKVTVYRVADREKDVSKIFRFFMQYSDDLSWLLQLVNENDPSLLSDYKEEGKEHLQKLLKEEEDVFLFVNAPFEVLEGKSKEHFSILKTAVKHREYRTIHYNAGEQTIFKNAKCLKIIYAQNNWYLAIETDQRKFGLLRISFIEDVQYAEKVGYQKEVLKKYETFFLHIQNAMSLYDTEIKQAHLKASTEVAKYFKKEMKPFFRTQAFVRENEDGSVEFTIDYTNDMEILPFIKQWQPNITILKPKSLQQALIQDLRKALQNQEEVLSD
jgi:predicted DNA-binding transcriptional regulator YafY